MSGRRALGAMLVVSLQLVAPLSARADAIAEASKQFTLGLAADKRQDYQKAVAFYRKAYDIKPHPNAAYNIAVDLEKLGQMRDAAGWYQTYEDTVDDATEKQTTKQHIEELENLPAALTVKTEPVGAQVRVDNVVVGTTPYGDTIEAGHHTLQIGTESRELTVIYGEPQDFDLELTPEQFGAPATQSNADLQPPSIVDARTLAPPPGEAGGGIRFRGGPKGAYIFIDNQAVGVLGADPFEITLVVGSHDVSIQRPGFEPWKKNVYVDVHQQIDLDVPDSLKTEEEANEDKSGKAHWVFGVAGGLGLSKDTTGEMVVGEFGIRGPKLDIVTRVGEFNGSFAFDAAIRYSIGSTRLRPLVGGGYSYIGKAFNYEIIAGLRADLKKYGTTRFALVAETGLRLASKKDDAGNESMSDTGVIFPLLMFVEVTR